MRKYLKILLIILTITSCKTEIVKEIEISEQFKLEFLNEILSDTIDIKIIESKEQLISNSPTIPPPFYLEINPENPKVTFSFAKFISDTLKIYDTTFVKNQSKSNNSLNLNELTKYGFRIFDMESAINEQKENGYFLIDSKIDSLNKGKNSYKYLSITKPIFNKELNLAFIRVAQGYGGNTIILKKENGKWKRKYTVGGWVE
jgi:hypothetical protein